MQHHPGLGQTRPYYELRGRGWGCVGLTKRKHVSPEALDGSVLPKRRKPIPHEFVLDAISALSPHTRPMFGCLAIYVKDKIVLILRDKPTNTADNGVWLATTEEHHQSLRVRVPKHAVDSSIGETRHGLASPTSRCPRLRISGAAGMRACAGWRCSDRQNSGRTSVWKIVEADQNLEETREHD